MLPHELLMDGQEPANRIDPRIEDGKCKCLERPAYVSRVTMITIILNLLINVWKECWKLEGREIVVCSK